LEVKALPKQLVQPGLRLELQPPPGLTAKWQPEMACELRELGMQVGMRMAQVGLQALEIVTGPVGWIPMGAELLIEGIVRFVEWLIGKKSHWSYAECSMYEDGYQHIFFHGQVKDHKCPTPSLVHHDVRPDNLGDEYGAWF
jgi:hypothetical protein